MENLEEMFPQYYGDKIGRYVFTFSQIMTPFYRFQYGSSIREILVLNPVAFTSEFLESFEEIFPGYW